MEWIMAAAEATEIFVFVLNTENGTRQRLRWKKRLRYFELYFHVFITTHWMKTNVKQQKNIVEKRKMDKWWIQILYVYISDKKIWFSVFYCQLKIKTGNVIERNYLLEWIKTNLFDFKRWPTCGVTLMMKMIWGEQVRYVTILINRLPLHIQIHGLAAYLSAPPANSTWIKYPLI